MTAEKPSEVALTFATKLYESAVIPQNQITDFAHIIDRKAVAPAVRGAVRLLKEVNDHAFQQAALGHIKITIGMNEADKLVSRYRHLIKEEGT